MGGVKATVYTIVVSPAVTPVHFASVFVMAVLRLVGKRLMPTAPLKASYCPKCGAPVDFRALPSEQFQVKCDYCATLINVPGRTPPRPPQAKLGLPKPAVVVTTSSRSGCAPLVVWMAILACLAIVSLAMITGMLTTSLDVTTTTVINEPANISRRPPNPLPSLAQAVLPKPRLFGAPIVLGGSDDSAVQMVLPVLQDEATTLIGFDPRSRLERWRSPAFSDEFYALAVVGSAAQVIIADGAQLVALDRQTGVVQWRTSLANDLQSNCPAPAPCLHLVGDQVITLARDGTLQAFVAADGAPRWSRPLNGTPRQLWATADQVIAVETGERNRARILALDPATGDLRWEALPACAAGAFGYQPHPSDQFLLTPAQDALVVAGSGPTACAWRYALADGREVTRYTSTDLHEALPFTWSQSSVALDDAMLYFVNDRGDDTVVWAWDSLSAAAPQPLYAIPGYELTVLRIVGEQLLVAAAPDFAREEIELWAIDRSSGARRWQRKLDTTHTFDDWLIQPTAAGLFAAVCYWDTDACRFEVMDAATGVSRTPVAAPVSSRGSMGVALTPTHGYLILDGALYGVDVTTAAVEFVWP